MPHDIVNVCHIYKIHEHFGVVRKLLAGLRERFKRIGKLLAHLQEPFKHIGKLVAALRDAFVTSRKLAALLRDASVISRMLPALLREGFGSVFISNSSIKWLKMIVFNLAYTSTMLSVTCMYLIFVLLL